MVFQQFNLFNNMNVMHNLTAAPTRIKGMDKEPVSYTHLFHTVLPFFSHSNV